MAMTDSEKREFKDIIKDGFETQRQYFEAVINPMKLDITGNKDIVKEIPIIKQKLDNHLETHITTSTNKKFNIEMWVIIGVYLLDKVMAYIKA